MPRGWGREATKERGWWERALRAGVLAKWFMLFYLLN
jgi:hypothetical protein